MEDLTGKQLGPYQVVKPLGEGGMAAVYKAYQASMDRYIALKILPRHFASDPEFVGRFTQEAKVIANLQHPHILPVHDFGEADGYTYLAMRFIEGGTLSDWLQEHTPLPMNRIRHIISQVGGALDYAHARGVIHRDIKPSNILMDQWDNCLLTDFGLAKMVAATSYLTQTGGILGTPAYMSPEQGLGRKVDHRSDIYSLGVVLYQMAVGYLPYQAETPMAVVIKHIHDPLPPPSQHDPSLPEAVERIILKSLAKNPEDRFAAAGDLVKALQSATELPTIAGVAPVKEEESPPPATPRPPVSTTAETIAWPDEESEPEAEPERETAAAPTTTEVMQRPEPVEEITAADEASEPMVEPAVATATTPPAAPSRRKSKLPWVLGGIGAVVVLAVLAFALNGLFSGPPEEETPDLIQSDEGGAQPPPAEVPATSLDDIMAQLEIAYEQGDAPGARELLDQAIALDPQNADLYCQRGYTMRDLEAFAEAVADFEQCWQLAKAQGLQEFLGEARGMLAVSQSEVALFREDNPERALAAMEEALADPDSPPWLQCERGELLLTLGNRPDAVAAFEMCQSSDGIGDYYEIRSTVAILQIQGEMALEEELPQVAVENFSRWAELEPEEPWPHCYLGEALLQVEAFDQAATAFDRCRSLTDDPGAHQWASNGFQVARAKEAMANENWEAALRFFEGAIESAPDEAWIYCERAELHIFLGARPEALHDIEFCRELAGDDPGIIEWADGLLNELEGSGG